MNEILTMPSLWAILPEELRALKAIGESYLKGERTVTGNGLPVQKAALLDINTDNISESFFMDGDIAVMQIEGVIFPKANIFSFIFGGSTIDVMTRDFNTLVNDDSVKAIVLDIDSPGGAVFGVLEFANLIYEARSVKPIASITSTVMASGAAIIGAAAEDVFITDEAVTTGSLAVLQDHIDFSKLEEKLGIKTTHISSGKYKRITSSSAPLSEEGREVLQTQVDHVDRAMVGNIARFRDTSEEDVRENMAQGKIFIGSMGIEAGLIDDIISADELINRINAEINKSESPHTGRASNINTFNGGKVMPGAIANKKGTQIMTVETVQEDNPGVYSQIHNLGAREAVDDLNAAKAESYEKGREHGKGEGEIIGAKSELERIMAVRAQMVPGHEALIAKLETDGLTTGPEAAVKVVKAENELRTEGLKTFKSEAADAVDNDVETETTGEKDKKGKKDFETLVAEHKEEHKCGVREAMKACARLYPDARAEYIKNRKQQ